MLLFFFGWLLNKCVFSVVFNKKKHVQFFVFFFNTLLLIFFLHLNLCCGFRVRHVTVVCDVICHLVAIGAYHVSWSGKVIPKVTSH